LYDFLREKENSVVFIHHDNPYLKKMATNLQLIPYGEEADLFVNGHVTDNSPYLCFEWKKGTDGEMQQVRTQLIVEYNFPNALAAVTIGTFFDVLPQRINEALSDYTPQNNRSQLKQTAHNTLIIDAYNANPTSMMAALENFRNMKADRKVLLLGDMLELGADSLKEHQKIVDFIDGCPSLCVLVGHSLPHTQQLCLLPHCCRRAGCFSKRETQGCTVLIKGSNGTKLSTLVDAL
jgi:UDP-N-acetylmuramoyl-tripeptide--D-alanyl-D-alanine ligase